MIDRQGLQRFNDYLCSDKRTKPESQSWFEVKKEYTKGLVAIFLSMALCKKEMQISTKVLSQGLSGLKNMGKKN